MSDVPSCRPDVETQIETLKAIHEYNKKLPKRRKKKDSLSECSVTNIVATSTVARKTNKKTKKKTIELVTHYKPVGITDGTEATPFSKDKYSLTNKQIAVQRSASAIKIKTLRTQYDKLLIMDQPQEKKEGDTGLTLEPCSSEPRIINNPWMDDTQEDAISLSVYNGVQQCIARRPRPVTTQDALLRRIPGWKPPKVKEEVGPDGEPIPTPALTEVPREPILPKYADLSDLLSKDATDAYRQE